MVWLRGISLVALGLTVCLSQPGCVPVPVCASNPIPNLTTVAVVPFFNLSAERSVDGRRFAIAYFSELQKTPGFQVLPVGVVEQAIIENRLAMDTPADALRLAEVLNVDAVVMGAVTEYNPYYPPKLGLQVQWYSHRTWLFYPGVPNCPNGLSDPAVAARSILRGQSPEEPQPVPEEFVPVPRGRITANGLLAPSDVGPPSGPEPIPTAPITEPQPSGEPAPLRPIWRGESPGPQVEPLMAYTRFFDGADPRLIAALRRYVVWRADRRSGDWEAHLHRSEDFIQFASYLMVLEMLSQHGAPVQTEYLPFWK